jgi:hypothetical protein
VIAWLPFWLALEYANATWPRHRRKRFSDTAFARVFPIDAVNARGVNCSDNSQALNAPFRPLPLSSRKSISPQPVAMSTHIAALLDARKGLLLPRHAHRWSPTFQQHRSNCDLPFIRLMSPPTNTGYVPRPTRLTKGMTPLAHPQEMREISVQLGARIRPPPGHHLSNIPSSPAAISGPLRPSLRRPSFEGTRQVSTSRGSPSAARSERALQVHEPRESPAAITTQPLVSAA